MANRDICSGFLRQCALLSLCCLGRPTVTKCAGPLLRQTTLLGLVLGVGVACQGVNSLTGAPVCKHASMQHTWPVLSPWGQLCTSRNHASRASQGCQLQSNKRAQQRNPFWQHVQLAGRLATNGEALQQFRNWNFCKGEFLAIVTHPSTTPTLLSSQHKERLQPAGTHRACSASKSMPGRQLPQPQAQVSAALALAPLLLLLSLPGGPLAANHLSCRSL